MPVLQHLLTFHHLLFMSAFLKVFRDLFHTLYFHHLFTAQSAWSLSLVLGGLTLTVIFLFLFPLVASLLLFSKKADTPGLFMQHVITDFY